MSEPKTITVKIKYDDERVVKQKFLVYEDINVCSEDPELRKLVEMTMEGKPDNIEDISITIKIEYQ